MAASQSTITDLLVLAVAKTHLRDFIAPEAFRERVAAEWSALSDGGGLRLDLVWGWFTALPDFDVKLGLLPFCWLKALEGRLGLEVRLPPELAGLKSNEVATNAAKVFIKREDVDGLLGPDTTPRGRVTTPPSGVRGTQPISGVRTSQPISGVRTSQPISGVRTSGPVSSPEPGAPPASLEPGAPPASLEPGASPASGAGGGTWKPTKAAPVLARDTTPIKRAIAGVAGVALLVSLVFMSLSFKEGCRKQPTGLDAKLLGEIPAAKGKRMGPDATFVLTDTGWLEQPQTTRDAQLTQALSRLDSSGVNVLVLLDEKGKPRASVQKVGQQVQIRYY